METQTYDIIVMLGVIMLVAIIIFWAVSYGAGIVSDIMTGAPAVLQSSFASYASAACAVDGDMFIEHKLPKRYPMYVFMNATHVRVRPAESQYYPYTETERGGYLGFESPDPLPFVGCGINVAKKSVLFNQNLHKSVTLDKTGNSMEIGVR